MLSDATRVRLLWLLLDGERAVNDLATRVGKPATAVSQHLAKLRLSGLVATRRQANQVYYRIESEHILRLVEDVIFEAEHAASARPAHHHRDRTESEAR